MTTAPNPRLLDLDEDTAIYRIVKVDFLLNDMLSNSLTLPRLLSWEDPYEAPFYRATLSIGNLNTQIEHLGLDWFGQCWSIVEESDAMWRIYNSKNDSVRIESTVGQLYNGIATTDSLIGRVKYHPATHLQKIISNASFSDVENDKSGVKCAQLLLLKRDYFQHEQEIRLLCPNLPSNSAYLSGRHHREFITNGESEFLPEFIHLPFDWKNIINSVMIGPQASDDKEQSIRRKLSHAIQGITITKSSMYEAPTYSIGL
jgi:hypothetical protein